MEILWSISSYDALRMLTSLLFGMLCAHALFSFIAHRPPLPHTRTQTTLPPAPHYIALCVVLTAEQRRERERERKKERKRLVVWPLRVSSVRSQLGVIALCVQDRIRVTIVESSLSFTIPAYFHPSADLDVFHRPSWPLQVMKSRRMFSFFLIQLCGS